MEALAEVWPQLDALLVLDQVSEAECGVITSPVREALGQLGESRPGKFILADSRERIGLFRSMSVKPNERECEIALRGWGIMTALTGGGLSPVQLISPSEQIRLFAERMDRAVFCTRGELGIDLATGGPGTVEIKRIPAYKVSGPIDPVGAGDSTSAAIACAVAAGATLEEAAAFGNLVASITIQQIGTTGTASPEQVRQRWREVRG
jgi:sugar/nucleoside kinase (ribokinase family)